MVCSPDFWWPSERVARLRELLSQKMSFTLIGRELGVSRSAVGGKVKRLGLSQPRSEIRIHRKHREPYRAGTLPRSHRYYPALRRPPTVIPNYPEPTNDPMSLWDVERRHCRYPHQETSGLEIMFCSAPTVEGLSWCPYHLQIVTGRKSTPAGKQHWMRYYLAKARAA